ncbi:cell envelope integrity protein TolA [Orbus hercynius]|nr:cell envelope integrity protein TolA [Orbus hercynius]
MPKNTNSKFSFALITSILLHVILIAVLSYSAWQSVSLSENNPQGESIDAIMIDTNIISEQYQRQLQHQLDSKQVKQQQQAQIEKQAQVLQQNQLAEQQRLKELEKQRLLAVEKQQQEQDAIANALAEKQKIQQDAEKARAQLEEQQKQALIAKQKADDEAKLRAEKERQDKQRIESERQKAEQEKQQALAEAEKAKQEAEKQKQILEQERLKVEKNKQEKLRIAQEAKQKAQEELQRQQAVNDLLGGLTSSVPKSQQGVSNGELDQFKSQIHNAISNKFINPKLYNGKNCVLKIQLASDGFLINVTAQEGDGALCREAISATKLAKFPKPKNDEIYQKVKNLTIDFSPK